MAAITSNGTGGGNWSAGASWTGAAVPAEGDTVTIQNGDTITIDQNITVGADTTTAAIDIASGGKLELLHTAAADYILACKGDLKVSSGGTLEIGTVANPIPAARIFTIKLNYSATLAEGEFGLLNYGDMIIQGDPARITVTKCMLNTDAAADATGLTSDVSTGWKDNDVIAIASTSRTWSQAENGTMNGNAAGTALTVDGFGGAAGGLAYAHSGTSPTQAEIINLTRNVVITSYNTTYRGYVCCYSGSASDVDYVEFYMIGYNVTYKHGIEIRTTGVGDSDFAYCSVWGLAASNYSFYFDSSTQNVVIDNCVNYYTKRGFYITGTTNTISNNTIVKVRDNGLIQYNSNNTITGNTFTSCMGEGLYLSSIENVLSFSDNIAHSNSSRGFRFLNCRKGTISNTTSWRNNSYGIYLYFNLLTFSSLTCFGNSNSNIRIYASGATLDSITLDSDASYSTSYGIYIQDLCADITVEDGSLGDTVAHLASDIIFSTNGFAKVICVNTKLSSTIKVSNIYGAIAGSYVQCEDLGQVTYADKAWYVNGIVVRDSSTYKYGSYATRFDYQANNAEWLEYDIYIPVTNGEQIVVSAWLRKNSSYTDTNRPKITMSGQGITEDSDQMSDVTDTWERVTVSGIPTRTGLAKLTISTYLVNSGASAWVDFQKTDILSGVLNTIECDFWANGHIAEVFMDTGSITAAEFWKTLLTDVDKTGSFGNLIEDYLDAAVSNCVRSTTPANTLNISAAGEADVDVIKISGDSTAADNIEATYDGTGYTNDSAPATQEQVGRLTSGTAAVNTTTESFTKSGAEPETNTYTATVALDGIVHKVEDIVATGITDCYYQFDVGGNGVPISITWQGYAQGKTDTYTIWAYKYSTSTYEQIGSIDGANGTTIIDETFSLTNAHVGTGANLGKVRFRFLSADGSAFATDRILCSYAIVTKSVGYSEGSIWVNTNVSNTNTEAYVDGTADNPVSTWAAAKTLSVSLGIKKFHIVNGSTITLDSNSDNYTFVGYDYNLALGSQSLENTYIENAIISGTATSGSGKTYFHKCNITSCSIGKAQFTTCGFEGTITVSAAETYIVDRCHNAADGSVPPIIDFGAAIGDTHCAFRDWQGGIEVTNLGQNGSDVFSVTGKGKVFIASTCTSGTIKIVGEFTIQDNVSGGFSGTLAEDARYDVDQINAECDTALTDYDPPTRTETTSDKNEILTDHTLMKQTTTGTYDRDTDSQEAIRDNQASSSSIATAVWSKQLSDLTVVGSIGNYIKSKLLSVAKFLVLK